MAIIDRQTFLKDISLLAGASLLAGTGVVGVWMPQKSAIKLGLVTYLWGKDWEVPTLLKNCIDTGIRALNFG